jgi:prepilin-type N-terminal cleavage/methylation domain-containing protein
MFFTTRNPASTHGFSMIEMSIVLMILAIVLTGGLLAAASFVQRQAHSDTEKQIDDIHQRLNRFHARTGYLPCPASLTIPLNGLGFGTAAPADCSSNTATPAGTHRIAVGGQHLRIGALPTRAIGLADAMMSDGYGNRFIYAVTEEHTNAESFAQTQGLGGSEVASHVGVITIRGEGTTPTASDVSYAIISAGKNGSKRGAHRFITGAQPASCSTSSGTGLDRENCDHANAIFRETRINDGDEDPDNYYDDIIRFTQRAYLNAFSMGNISSECNSTNHGIVRYNTTSNTREYCNGSNWDDVPDSTAASGGEVPCYAFEEGMVRIDPDTVGSTNTVQECDGDIWRNV